MDTELQESLKQIASFIKRCKKVQPKFKEGSAQHTLLKNRIQALCIAQDLLSEKKVPYTIEMLESAIAPLASIDHKCSKAQSKYALQTSGYQRYVNMILAMRLALKCIKAEIKLYEKNEVHER